MGFESEKGVTLSVLPHPRQHSLLEREKVDAERAETPEQLVHDQIAHSNRATEAQGAFSVDDA